MPFGIEIDMTECGKQIAKMMADFGVTYAKNYQVALVKKILDDSFDRKEAAEVDQHQLKDFPEEKAPDKKGMMKNKSAILGRWKERYFFVKENYDLGYSSAPEGKEDGAFNLWGYKVQSLTNKPEGPRRGGPDWIPDEERPNCKKCNKEFSNVIWHHHCRNCGEVFCADCSGNKAMLTHFGYEKPQRVCDDCCATLGRQRAGSFAIKQPDEKADAGFHGIHLLHATRTPYLLECQNLQEKKEWMEVLAICCRKASLPINPDPVQAAAFQGAYQETMRDLGYYYAWRVTGTEVEMLSDLFGRSIDRNLVSPAFERAVVPPSVKRMAANAINAQVIKLVRAAVQPGWKAITAKISENSAAIEGKVRPLVEPIGRARNSAVDPLRQKIAELTGPALDRLGRVAMDKVLELASRPMTSAFEDMFVAVHKAIGDAHNRITDRHHYDSFITTEMREFHGYWGRLHQIHRTVDELVQKIKEQQAEHEALKYFPVSKTFDGLKDTLHRLVNRTFYTMQQDETMAEPTPAKVKVAWTSVQAKLLHDSQLEIMCLLNNMLQDAALGPVQDYVLGSDALKAILDPIDAMIPDAVKEYLSVSKMVEELVTGAVSDAVSRTVEASASGTKGELERSMRALNL